MKNVLFLPFLQMSSGHHQVADSLSDYIKMHSPEIRTKKVDILQHTFGYGEKLITGLYLKSIKYLPSLYNQLYKSNALKSSLGMKRYLFYELLFYSRIRKLIEEDKPDLIVCTHCLPSYLLNRMKRSGVLKVPVINAYTDYFINTVWGLDQIDYHLVPSILIKNQLIQNNISKDKIFVTGIPVHRNIFKRNVPYEQKDRYNVLVTGGNLGVGSIENLFKQYQYNNKLHYLVLCGKNEKLYNKLTHLNLPNVKPIGYISCRKKMNSLYDEVDAVVTKPGGVTISECLYKGLPIMLLKALPGQEEMNKRYLLEQKLVIGLAESLSYLEMEENLLRFLDDQHKKNEHFNRLSSHQDSLVEFAELLSPILNMSKKY